ncbi:RpiB/LacA/LacB family sugar-phosphate isomerase [bacterium]|nr:RpiB/LacA/LacB family sugar-phosphate isomerase [bacterium]
MIYLGADHRGFYLKEAIKDYLTTRGIKWEDLGNQEYQEDDDYPLFARKVAQKVAQNPSEEKGILICGSGIGMSIAANRWKKVRAGLCLSGYMAEKGRKEDDINILVLAADITDEGTALRIVQRFLNTKFERRQRYQRRIQMLDEK